MRAEQCKAGTRFVYVGANKVFKGHVGTISETYDKTKDAYVKVTFDEAVGGRRNWHTTTREIKRHEIPRLISFEEFIEGGAL